MTRRRSSPERRAERLVRCVVTHAATLRQTPVRVASGTGDPFHAGVRALVRELPPTAAVEITKGCHDGAFFFSQQTASLSFLGQHLA